jgi:hypothetical protein
MLYSSRFRILFLVLKQDMVKFYCRTRKGIASSDSCRHCIDGYATNALARLVRFQNSFVNLTMLSMLAASRGMRYLSCSGSSGGRINLEKKMRRTRCKCGKIVSRLIRTTDVQTVLNNNLERPPHFDANPPLVVWFIGDAIGNCRAKARLHLEDTVPCELPLRC